MQPPFQQKRVFMKLAKIFISRNRCILRKLLAISEMSVKIKVKLHWILFLILLTLADTCKQTLLHENEIVQYLQNCKCYIVGQDHFRKPLKSSSKSQMFERFVELSKAIQS